MASSEVPRKGIYYLTMVNDSTHHEKVQLKNNFKNRQETLRGGGAGRSNKEIKLPLPSVIIPKIFSGLQHTRHYFNH